MLLRNLIMYFSLLLFFSSCSNITSPSIKNIKNAKLTGLNTKTLDFDLDLELFNPNNEALQVKSLKLTALIEGVELDAVDQNYDTKMLGKSTFLLPMNVGLSLKELAKKDSTDIMSKGLRIYNSGAIDLTLHGVLTLSDGVSNKVVNIVVTMINFFESNKSLNNFFKSISFSGFEKVSKF